VSDHIEVDGKKYYEAAYIELANATCKRRGEKIKTLTAEIGEYQKLISELYQVCGSLLADAGAFETEHGRLLLDRLRDYEDPTGESLLPWPAFRDDDGSSLQTKDTEPAEFEHYPWCEHLQNMARPRSQQLIGPKCTCYKHRRDLKELEERCESGEFDEALGIPKARQPG